MPTCTARPRGWNLTSTISQLLELCARKRPLVRAFYYIYYIAVAEDQEFSPLRPLMDWLDYNDFSAVNKPLKEFNWPST